MALKEVDSHNEMLGILDEQKKNYILLYKKGSETSNCSYKNIESALRKVKGVNVAAAGAMVARSGQQGVPQTDINGEIIVGFDKNRINTLLGIH